MKNTPPPSACFVFNLLVKNTIEKKMFRIFILTSHFIALVIFHDFIAHELWDSLFSEIIVVVLLNLFVFLSFLICFVHSLFVFFFFFLSSFFRSYEFQREASDDYETVNFLFLRFYLFFANEKKKEM